MSAQFTDAQTTQLAEMIAAAFAAVVVADEAPAKSVETVVEAPAGPTVADFETFWGFNPSELTNPARLEQCWAMVPVAAPAAGTHRNAAGRLVDDNGRFVKDPAAPASKASKKAGKKAPMTDAEKAAKKAAKSADNKAIAASLRAAGKAANGAQWANAKSGIKAGLSVADAVAAA